MEWTELQPIDNPAAERSGLNKRIAGVVAFRTQATSNEPPRGRFYRPEDAINEALRREVMVRAEMAKLLKAIGADGAGNADSLAEVRRVLNERQAHRS